MRIDVVGRNLEITPAIREYAQSKAEKLPRYFDGVQLTTITATKEDHQTRGTFGVEFVIDVEKHASFVAKASHTDLYAAIDQAESKAQRQLHDFKEKLKQGNR
ncbi:Ribosome hibernation promoting factor Hpf [hydrothermal vent metagenome]|uniref:Ribosome hibernation promoting factor Hpf n=1 Tax=hydrothermal vent metagenome TaxID=652676 RepID=A0A3B1DCB6_9ZZZZ